MFERFIEPLAILFLSPHTNIVGGYYSGLSTIFALVIFILLYVLFWNVIKNDTFGIYTRTISKWMLRTQTLLFAIVFSFTVYIVSSELSCSTLQSVTSAIALFFLIQVLQQLLIHRLSATTVHAPKGRANGKISLGKKISTFSTIAWSELKMVGDALKQDVNYKFIRTVIAYAICSIFCHIFILPFAIVSGWIFGAGAVLEGGIFVLPTSFLLAFLFDRKLKKKLLSNQKLDPAVKTPAESGNEQGTAGHL